MIWIWHINSVTIWSPRKKKLLPENCLSKCKIQFNIVETTAGWNDMVQLVPMMETENITYHTREKIRTTLTLDLVQVTFVAKLCTQIIEWNHTQRWIAFNRNPFLEESATAPSYLFTEYGIMEILPYLVWNVENRSHISREISVPRIWGNFEIADLPFLGIFTSRSEPSYWSR